MEKSSAWKEYLIYVVVFILIAIVMPKYVLGKTVVDGKSMETTLKDKEWLLTDKLTYRFRQPKRFDVVVFNSPEEKGEYWVKRVIGLPGETIQILDGKVCINGKNLKGEHYGNASIDYTGVASAPYRIPEGTYFLMGDNRVEDHSWDSRYEEVGTISEKDIWGKVFFRIRPMKRIGKVK
ncbi:MAG: signal peptidase I [Acetivibrio sp.]